jgi:hypothetical protein
MNTIKDHNGNTQNLSDQIYEITKITFPDMHPAVGMGYDIGDKVRLISGIDNNTEPGYHFAKGFVTVCRIDALTAEFLGVKRNHIRKAH